MGSGSGLCRTAVSLLAGSTLCSLAPRIAHAVDEIQLYNADINEVGQFSIQQHVNYTITGIPTPAYPGALISNHALNETPEFAYGVTPWLELGLYVPGAVNEQGQFLSNNIKLRTLFAIPDAAKKDFFYGLNFEYDFPSWPFVPSRFAMEVRPIIGWRNPQWEFIINPIIDFAWGQLGEVMCAAVQIENHFFGRVGGSLPPPGSRAISVRTGSSALSTIRASERPAIFNPFSSSRTSCSR
jgi:hypothetical protein